ncbi:hypothetical protein TSAR_009628 [Trichomalopsis sarcophagae]|uniref:AB hydrolase-1 domain-containing protein n=1 Tax=Trichomalopsis sarcophagae TaxID=543379 RepID=A0A232F150_9HYME|nr:hypothetical protein TSAR_009628 [Trichomalopsis sarcophagae]
MFAKQVGRLGSQTFGYLVVTRGIQQNAKLATCAEFTPVQIDVPWGKIEAKLWGSKDKQPLLAIHGWMDNAGSFDNIAPLLKHSSILAIDLPGHGLSSWIPKGFLYGEDICAQAMRLVVKKFGWKKVKLLGHSMGGILCHNYARLYPDETEFVVSIDALAFVPNTITKHSKCRAKAVDKLISFEKKVTEEPPSYPEEVAIDKWIKAVKFSNLDVPTTKTLMIRGGNRKDDGTYYYTRDYRLSIQNFNACYTTEVIREMTQLITCPYMVIKFSQTPFLSFDKYWTNVAEILTEKSSDFHFVEMDGWHHMHMMEPEKIADVINPFLEKHDV